MSESIIKIQNLTKYYGKHLALNDVSFEVQAGQVFALLGPNGAGKSTLVKCMLGLVHSSSGNVIIQDINFQDYNSRKAVAYLPEKFSFYPFYKVRAVLEFFCSLKGVLKTDQEKQIDYAIELMGIGEFESKKVKELSKGQLQRLGIATTLLADSKIIILDEPFSGLDPIALKDLKELILQLKKTGKSIFINSHLLGEMQSTIDSCALLHKGQLVANGDLPEVLKGESLEDFFYSSIKSLEQ